MEKMMKIATLVMILTVVIGDGAARSMAQGICKMNEEGLMACRPSVSGSRPPNPSVTCCRALASADIPCLCSYRNSPILPEYGINPALAMQLPAKCNLPHAHAKQ